MCIGKFHNLPQYPKFTIIRKLPYIRYLFVAVCSDNVGISSSKVSGDSVRECFIKFALSFIIVGEVDVITRVLEIQG